MTRAEIQVAIQSGVPFTLRLVDGREYRVPHRDYISLSPKGGYVTVYDEKDRFYILPFFKMAALVFAAASPDSPRSRE